MSNCFSAYFLLASSMFFISVNNGFAQLPPVMTHKVIVADEGNGKVHYINLANPAERWSITTANRDLQLVGNDRLMVSVGDGYAEYNVKTGALIKKVTTGGAVQSAFRLAQKSTFVGADGSPATIREVDSTGKTLRTVSFAVNASIRIVRPTLAKTFLVGGKIAGTMYECDSTGKIIWEANAGGEPYMALRLPGGNTLISNGYGGQMVLVDSKSKVIKAFPTQADKNGSQFWTQAAPNFFAGFQVLKNGNIVVSNWQGHGGGNGGKGFQLIEIDSGLTQVISYWKQDAAIVSSLHGVLVIDSLDTKNIYSDINGILAPVTPQAGVAQPARSGYALPKSAAAPAANVIRMVGLNGRLISGNPAGGAAGVYVGHKRTVNILAGAAAGEK